MPSSQSPSTSGLRAVCLVLMVLGLLAAGVALLGRISAESQSRNVELVVDYNEVIALAGQQGVLPNRVLTELRKAGVTSVALQEETLGTLENQGEITLTAHPAFAGRFGNGWVPTDTVFTVETGDPGAIMTGADVRSAMASNVWLVLNNLPNVYPRSNLQFEPPFRVLVRGSRDTVSELGLGLYGKKVDLIKASGLRVTPRLRANPHMTPKAMAAGLAAVAAELPEQKHAALPRGIVIFDGDSLPGYRALIPQLANELRKNNLAYGSVEFGKQKGDPELGAKLKGQLVRVHSISKEELANLTIGQVVQRFALAAKDRNIRVLYLHLPELASPDPLKASATYVRAIKSAVTASGLSVNPQKIAHPFPAVAVPTWLLIPLFLGAGASVLLWVLRVLPERLPLAYHRVLYAVLTIGMVMAVALAVVAPSLGRASFGLIAAVGFPLLALTWAYNKLEGLLSTRPARAAVTAVTVLLMTTGVTVLGGLLVAGMFGETRYLVKVGQFSGVKMAEMLPLFLFAALLVTDGIARAGESLDDYLRRCRERLRGFLHQPIYLWGIVLAVVALAVVGLTLARSGNDAGVGVSGVELQMRSALEQLLIARPRTKEFLFGHPLMLLSLLAAARGYRVPALFLLLGAAIGQVDVLNTYCHAHTPVLLSLLRTVNGLWLGIIIGVVLMVIMGWSKAKKA